MTDPGCELTLVAPGDPETFLDAMYPASRIMLASGSEHWCSSDEILNPVRRFDEIAFDPFSNANSRVGARQEIMLPQDSLLMDWPAEGLIYTNPPYGDQLPRCAQKIGDEARRGREIMTLVPARVDTNWWQNLLAPMYWCAWTGRVHFLETEEALLTRHAERVTKAKASGQRAPKLPRYKRITDTLVMGDPAPFAVALCYSGHRWQRFVDMFSEYGNIYKHIVSAQRRGQIALPGL